jgi:hypothetical protein
MKKISKKKLDYIIALTREYWETGNRNILGYRIDKATELQPTTGLSWSGILDFVDGILHGFAPDATDDEIYCALRVLGWEATDEIETSESL